MFIFKWIKPGVLYTSNIIYLICELNTFEYIISNDCLTIRNKITYIYEIKETREEHTDLSIIMKGMFKQ